jgi:hypothetical protein
VQFGFQSNRDPTRFDRNFIRGYVPVASGGRNLFRFGVIVFSSLEQVAERLHATGYIADSIATTTVYLSAKLHKPLLLEGPAGSGKTQLA